MKHQIMAGSVIAAVLVLGTTGCGLKKNTKAAEAEVDRFHQRWNSGEFQAVFDDAHLNFREAQPAEKMVSTLQAVKKNYGDFKSSTQRHWGFNSDKGNTDIKLSYDSSYERGNAVEEFIFRMTGGKALLVSYDIARPEVAAKREAEKKAARDAKREEDEAKRKAEREARKKP